MADRTIVEAEIIHDIPDDIATLIGRIMVCHAKLEYKLTMITALLLQLNKAEARIVLREPRAEDRLEIALDVFAIKGIELATDVEALRLACKQATTGRDWLAHGLWMEDPETNELYLRIARGSWPKIMTPGTSVKRAIFPQSIPYSAQDCRATLALIDRALELVEQLGGELDQAILAYPDRFRPTAPIVNHLGIRPPKPKQTPTPPKNPKGKKKK